MAIWQSQDGILHDDMDGQAQSTPEWPQGMILLSDEQVAELRRPSLADELAAYHSKALALLILTDTVALRCVKAGVPFPADWLAYTSALRAASRAHDTNVPMPTAPTVYPAGT